MKNAIVTGGTKGIGLSICKLLLQNGYFVYLTYSKDDVSANECETELFKEFGVKNFKIVKADQSNYYALQQLVSEVIKEVKSVDCLVCNAGTTIRKSTKDISNNEWEKVFNVCVNSHFYLIRDLWEKLRDNSRIIFIGSMMGVLPHSTSLAYGVAKSAIHALAKNLVKDFAGTGTTVNVIAPGFIETKWQGEKPKEIRENICKKTAQHCFGTPTNVASAVEFCINNSFVNGAVIEVSGGYCYE